MRITVNGEPRELADSATVGTLVAEMGLEGGRLAVEVDGEIVPRSTHAEHPLTDGAKVEIVHAVGGG